MTEYLATAIIRQVVSNLSVEELYELALDLQISDEKLLTFCDRFELGNWFYDEMTLLGVKIVDEISVIADEAKAERQAEVDNINTMEKEYRIATSGGSFA